MTEYETPALEIDGLGIRLPGEQAARPILDGVSLRVGAGETVGLVGESGSGKSVACRSVLGLLPAGARTSGEVRVAGRDVLTMKRAELAGLRARQVAMIFQDPRASVNPLRRVGDFLTEGLRGAGTPAAAAENRAEELLDAVGIRDPRGALRRYPHQFSGGMLQRVVIAAALAGNAGAAGRRRADHSSRRHHPGGDHRHPHPPPGRTRHRNALRHPRPRTGLGDLRPRVRHVRGPDRRNQQHRRAVRPSTPPVHGGAPRLHTSHRGRSRLPHAPSRAGPSPSPRPHRGVPSRRAAPTRSRAVPRRHPNLRTTATDSPRATAPTKGSDCDRGDRGTRR